MRIDQPGPDEPDEPRLGSADRAGRVDRGDGGDGGSRSDRVDRGDGGDHGDRGAGAGPSGKRPEAGVSREEQIAEHIRYREIVAATDRAAADRAAWAEATPRLRTAWEEHKQRYPERERDSASTQADGSWVCGEYRRLDPEQNTEASKAHADLADEADRHILPAMRRVEDADPDRRLAGLKHMVRGEDRLKEKLADVLLVETHLTTRQAVDKVPDAVRFTLTYSTERYTDGVLADVDRLKAEGFELSKLKNLWHTEQYKGINSQWRRPETGLRFEMQFHTPESLEAKELTHEAYERLRRPEAETSQVERDELEEFQRRANSLITTPLHTETIKDFPEKRQ